MAFKMKGFPYKSAFNSNGPDDNVKSNSTVYITVDGVPLTYGEYQTYDKTGKMPSGSRSRRGKTDVDLSDIVEKEESMGIVRPKPKKEDLDYIDNPDAPPPEWEQ